MRERIGEGTNTGLTASDCWRAKKLRRADRKVDDERHRPARLVQSAGEDCEKSEGVNVGCARMLLQARQSQYVLQRPSAFAAGPATWCVAFTSGSALVAADHAFWSGLPRPSGNLKEFVPEYCNKL